MDEKPPIIAPSVTSWIEPASKIGALSLFVVYAVGYLTTSLSLGARGMVLTNPFKPHIAAAGVLFCIFFGIPILLYTETMKNLEMPSLNLSSSGWFRASYKLLTFFHVCLLAALPLQRIFELDKPSAKWKIWTLFFILVLDSTFIATHRHSAGLRKKVVEHTFIATISYSLATVLSLILCLPDFQGHLTWLQIPLWLYVCGFYFATTRDLVKLQLGGAFANLFVQALFPIFIFSTVLYPHIKSEWGGGQPVAIVLLFTKDSPLFPNQEIRLQLLDESDAGFYVLRSEHRYTLFIPRASVATILYGNDERELP